MAALPFTTRIPARSELGEVRNWPISRGCFAAANIYTPLTILRRHKDNFFTLSSDCLGKNL